MGTTINLDFKGYWLNKTNVPSVAGIYLVYVGKYNKDKDTVSLRRLIYIGEAKDVNERLSGHKKEKEWKMYLNSGEILIFSVAKAVSPDRERAECALIFYHQPPTNDECKETFPYEETTVISTGRCKFIKPKFTVKKTQ